MKIKIFILIFGLLILCHCTNGITYLRPVNDRGPGTCLKCLNLQTIVTTTLIHFEGAMKAGMDCIEQVERYFFRNIYSEQIQNLAVFNSKNMKSPAMEIQFQYLKELHDRILHKEEEEERFQLKVISNVVEKLSVHQISFKDLILTNLYVIVADSLDNVMFLDYTKNFFMLYFFY
jgi:hypothetical protein